MGFKQAGNRLFPYFPKCYILYNRGYIMTILWTILGTLVGGGLGYLYGGWRQRRQLDACETPT